MDMSEIFPKSQLGFDPSNDYEPKYITIRGKGELWDLEKKQKSRPHLSGN